MATLDSRIKDLAEATGSAIGANAKSIAAANTSISNIISGTTAVSSATQAGNASSLGGSAASTYAKAASVVTAVSITSTGSLTYTKNGSSVSGGQVTTVSNATNAASLGGSAASAYAKADTVSSLTTTVNGIGTRLTSAESDISSLKTTVAAAYHYVGTVANSGALPTTGNNVGDVYNVTDTGMNYAWTSGATSNYWDALGQLVDLATASVSYAASAGKLTSDAGSNNAKAVYFSGGVPVAFTSTFGTGAWAAAYVHPSAGANAGSFGPAANATPAHGGTFSVPYVTVNSDGHVTAASTKTITLPAQYVHPSAGTNSGSFGPSANATPAHGGTFNVPYITVNSDGHVTAASTKTVTLPTVPVMGGAGASASGAAGLVPVQPAGANTKFLRGDGEWVVPTNTDTKVQQVFDNAAAGPVNLLASIKGLTATDSSTTSSVKALPIAAYPATGNLVTSGAITASGGFIGTATSATNAGTAENASNVTHTVSGVACSTVIANANAGSSAWAYVSAGASDFVAIFNTASSAASK